MSLGEGTAFPPVVGPCPTNVEEAKGKVFLVPELSTQTIANPYTYRAPLFGGILPALGFRKAVRVITPAVGALALATLESESSRHALLLLFTDDATGLRAPLTADSSDGPRYSEG